MQVPKRRSEQNRRRETGDFLITAAAQARLKRTLEQLKKTLPALIEEVERTKAFGDFSENAEYREAKYALRRTHGRIARIEDRLTRAVVLEVSRDASDVVAVGRSVTLETEGKHITYTILGSFETDPTRGIISRLSTLGSALIGRRVGETVTVPTRSGAQRYTIISVRV